MNLREGDSVAMTTAIEVNHTTVAAGSIGTVIDIDRDTGDLFVVLDEPHPDLECWRNGFSLTADFAHLLEHADVMAA